MKIKKIGYIIAVLIGILLGVFGIIKHNYESICSTAIIANMYPYSSINTFVCKGLKKNKVKVAIIDTGLSYDDNYAKFINLETGKEEVYSAEYSHGDMIKSIMCFNPIVEIIQEYIELIAINIETLSVENLINALQSAYKLNVDLINISLGTYDNNEELESIVKTITDSGIIIVAANGNDATNQFLYPASYNGVISVTCVDQNNNRMLANNYNDMVTISVPGEKIPINMEEKIEKTGSSASCAIATSVFSYLKCIKPSIDAYELIEALALTSSDIGTKGRDQYYGYGLLNMKKLVLYFCNPIYLMYE